MVNKAHQYQQSEQSPLFSDGQQFTPISTKRSITSKQWWSTMHININKRTIPLYCDGQQFHQYQQNKQSPLNIDGQQFTPISTKQTITSKQWWSTIHNNINKANTHLYKQWWSPIPSISSKRAIISKQWWSTIHTNISKANNHL